MSLYVQIGVVPLNETAVVVAAHTDIIGADVVHRRIQGETHVLDRRHVPTLRAGSIDVICDHLGGDTRYAFLPATGLWTTPLQRAMRMLDAAYLEVDESDELVIVRSVADIRKAKETGKISLVLCFEGGAVLEEDLAYLGNFFRLGLRCLGLTHNWRNALGDGCLERSGGGLTHFGRDVVQACNDLGIVVDISHLGARGVEDALQISTEPIIASHSNARSLHDHPHNLPDELIQGISAADGVVGVFFLDSYISSEPNPSPHELMRHVEHILEIGGEDALAVGPDILENWQEEVFKLVTESSPKFCSVPVAPIDYTYPSDFDSAAKLGTFAEMLKSELGMSRDAVTKILGENCMRLFGRVWPA